MRDLFFMLLGSALTYYLPRAWREAKEADRLEALRGWPMRPRGRGKR
jgi:hypothetical protein